MAMETAMIREAVALFDDPERLEGAVSDLQSRGFDRADISFLAHDALLGQPLGTRRLADDPAAPREPAISDTDIRQGRLLGTSLLATIAGFAAAGFTVAATGGLAAAAVAAVAAAGGVGAIGALFGQRLAEDEAAYLEAQLARGGVLLWVRTPEPAAEQRALEVLRRHTAWAYVHELPKDARQRLRPLDHAAIELALRHAGAAPANPDPRARSI
jgi:hypothetical protein